MKYTPALDGIRGLAVFAVIGFHVRALMFHGGYLGVDAFFVLSGFLITTLLLDELERTDTISFSHFYIRRFSRLLPALFLMLVGYNLIAPCIWPSIPQEKYFVDTVLTSLYLNDFPHSLWKVSHPLSHSWTLSVEGHFYLLWPVFLLLTRKLCRKKLAFIIGGLYLLASAWRIYNGFEGAAWSSVYRRFDTHCSGLFLGSLLAVLRMQKVHIPEKESFRALFLVFAGCCVAFSRWGNTVAFTGGIVSVEMATFFTIAICMGDSYYFFEKILTFKPVVYLGKISYGVYLYHFPIALLMRSHTEWWTNLVFTLGLTLPVAMLSYHLIERPISRKAREYLKRVETEQET